jgi:UDP-2,4-diacetamido-2,4,6-trideoxy-beta-L-altropyranose hydrolase
MRRPVNFVFRADASVHMGHGHVMRCLTLANRLRQEGASVRFICRAHPGHLADLIEAQGFVVDLLPCDNLPPVGLRPLEPESWLGVPWDVDARETEAVIQAYEYPPDWLVVDHYSLDQRWEQALRDLVGRIAVIDDVADRPHDCDLLLDQSLATDPEARYAGLIPRDCVRLFGPEYALLEPSFAELRDRIPPRSGAIRRVLLSFGGADPGNLTLRVLRVLALLGLNADIDVVLSGNPRLSRPVRREAERYDNVRVHQGLRTLAPLMASADLGIGAGGTTSWERLCLGLPSLVLTLAENQKLIAQELHERGLVRWLGDGETVSDSEIADAVGVLFAEGIEEAWSLRCSEAVDGSGAERVCASLLVSRDTRVQARSVTWQDRRALQGWAANCGPVVTTGPDAELPPDFRALLREVDSFRGYLVHALESAVGFVRFDWSEEVWITSHVLHPRFARPELDRPVLTAAIAAFRRGHSGSVTIKAPPGATVAAMKLRGETQATGELRLCVASDASSWMNRYIPSLMAGWIASGHQVTWVHTAEDAAGGDVCFFLSYGSIVAPDLLARFSSNVVVHESALPAGRGWSPLSWQVVEGATTIPVTLFEAAEGVDSGPIYLQRTIDLDGVELVDELREKQAEATLQLCESFVGAYPRIVESGRPQEGPASFYARRRPEDSELDIDKTVREQFNLLRICDNDRYPAWFTLGGHRFRVLINKET